MTVPDPSPERETVDDTDPGQLWTTRSIRLTQPPAPTGWTPPQPLVVTDFQWRLNCLKAQVQPCEEPAPAWLVTDNNPRRSA